jgi:hypothetical protein
MAKLLKKGKFHYNLTQRVRIIQGRAIWTAHRFLNRFSNFAKSTKLDEFLTEEILHAIETTAAYERKATRAGCDITMGAVRLHKQLQKKNYTEARTIAFQIIIFSANLTFLKEKKTMTSLIKNEEFKVMVIDIIRTTIKDSEGVSPVDIHVALKEKGGAFVSMSTVRRVLKILYEENRIKCIVKSADKPGTVKALYSLTEPAPAETLPPIEKKHELWDVWREDKEWKVQAPHGIDTFKTRAAAQRIVENFTNQEKTTEIDATNTENMPDQTTEPATTKKGGKKKTKGGTTNKTKNPKQNEDKPKSTGIIATIKECLSGSKPVTKAHILKILLETFPDREEKSMRNTVNAQVPHHLNAKTGQFVEEVMPGLWKLDTSDKAEKHKEAAQKNKSSQPNKKRQPTNKKWINIFYRAFTKYPNINPLKVHYITECPLDKKLVKTWWANWKQGINLPE